MSLSQAETLRMRRTSLQSELFALDKKKNKMSDFSKSLVFVAVAGSFLISAIALVGGNSYQQQTRKIAAYDRCLATQVQVAKLGGYPPSCSQ